MFIESYIDHLLFFFVCVCVCVCVCVSDSHLLVWKREKVGHLGGGSFFVGHGCDNQFSTKFSSQILSLT